jgi:hypothetical protein
MTDLPPFQERLHKAICAGYDAKSLEQLVRFRLEERLDLVAPSGAGLATVVFELIQWADIRNRMADLVRHAAEYNPTRTDLAELWREFEARPETAPAKLTGEMPRAGGATPVGPQLPEGNLATQLSEDRRHRTLMELLTALSRAADDVRPDRAGLRIIGFIIAWVGLTMVCGAFLSIFSFLPLLFGASDPWKSPALIAGTYLAAGVTVGWLLVRAAWAHRPAAEERMRRALDRLREEFPDEFAVWGEANLRDWQCLKAIIRNRTPAGPV